MVHRHGVARDQADEAPQDRGLSSARPRPGRSRSSGRKKTFKASLRTKDPELAKERATQVLAEFQAQWKKLSIVHIESGDDAINLSTRQIEAIAGEIYAEYVKLHEDEPGSRDVWVGKLREAETRAEFRKRHPGMAAFRNAAIANLPAVDAYLQERDLHVTGWCRARIGASLERLLAEANNRLLRNADGDYSPDEYAKRFPSYDARRCVAKRFEGRDG